MCVLITFYIFKNNAVDVFIKNVLDFALYLEQSRKKAVARNLFYAESFLSTKINKKIFVEVN